MMSSPFDRLMNTIRPHLPGSVDQAIKQELYFACLDFFKRSEAWRENIDFVLPADRVLVDVMPFAGRIERLNYVRDFDEYPVRGAYMETPGEIRFRTPFDRNKSMTANVTLVVTDPTTRDAFPIVPGPIVERYTEELMHGVLARMMAQPSKPYTNVGLAQFHLQQFRGGANRARNAVNKGHTLGSQNWHFPQSFAHR